MQHKIISIITALVILSTVTLIAGCGQANGNKTKDTIPQSNGPQYKFPEKELQGAWKIVAANDSYMMHVLYNTDGKLYAAKQNGYDFTKVDKKISYDKTTGVLKVDDDVYTLESKDKAFELKDDTGITVATMTKINDSGSTAKTAAEKIEILYLAPSKEEVIGVWEFKVLNDMKLVDWKAGYIMHIAYDGNKMFAALKRNERFVKFSGSVSYTPERAEIFMNVRSRIQISGHYLVKKDENTIEFKYRNIADATLTKDTKVPFNTIKEAKPMPATKAHLEANVWEVYRYSKPAVYFYFNQDKVYTAVEDNGTYKKYSADTFTYEEDNGAAVVKKNNIPFMTELMTDGSTVELEYRTIELKNATNSTFLHTSTLLKVEKNKHPTADEVKNAQ